MASVSLQGVCPIVDTPFTDDGHVDYGSLESLSRTLIAGGCHALALFGYASEFYKLDETERERMTEIVVDECEHGNVPSVISVTAQSTPVAIDQARSIEQAGADALMVLPPHVRGPPEDRIGQHLADVADAVNLPVMVQYAPDSTGITHSPGFFANLYNDVSNIEYFKIECTPPGGFIDRLQALTDDQAKVFVGRAGYEMIDGYDRGVIGVMPASAMYDIYLRIHHLYHNGNRDAAIDLHSELVAVLNQLTRVGIQYEKRILADRGLVESDHCRSPEAGFDETEESLYQEYFDRYIAPNIDVEVQSDPVA